MRTVRLATYLLLVALLVGGLPVHGLGLVGHPDPARDAAVYHGIAHADTEDEWAPSACATAVVDHELSLTVPRVWAEAELDVRLVIHAEHLGDDGFETISAIATPGDPATVEVRSKCTRPTFTVEALAVTGVTNYTVACTTGCWSGPPLPLA